MIACRVIKPTKFLNLSTHVGYWFYLFPHTRSYLVYLQYPFELNAVSYTRNWKIGASIFNVPLFHRTDSLNSGGKWWIRTTNVSYVTDLQSAAFNHLANFPNYADGDQTICTILLPAKQFRCGSFSNPPRRIWIFPDYKNAFRYHPYHTRCCVHLERPA